nr:hypothetical protein [Escherichia coli]
MQILKRRSDTIYLTEMGAFIARRIKEREIIKAGSLINFNKNRQM